MTTRERLFGYEYAFDHPVTVGVAAGALVLIVLALLVTHLLGRMGKISDKLRSELVARCVSWLVIAPAMLVPVLLGAAWTIAAICLLSLVCYREFARAIGLFRERDVSVIVVLGIFAITFAVADHWYGLFMALPSLTIAVLAAGTIFRDHPHGYIQRVALGIFGYLLFGVCLGHFSYFANSANYRAVMILIATGVELNDVFAFCCGKALGRHKLAPNTSPGKTIEGACGALLLTTTFVVLLGRFVFVDTKMNTLPHLIGLGLVVSIGGVLGDLTLSSIKRDVGIKDMGVTIPGHGGVLDRFNSLLLVAPAAFHYIGYFLGVGLDQPTRIITGP